MLLVSMCLIYIHSFCLLTSIYILLNHACAIATDKGNNKITELRTILQRESQNS